MRITNTGCCGVLELVDISTASGPAEVIDFVAKNHVHFKTMAEGRFRPYATFTGVIQRHARDHVDGTGKRPDDYGTALADYITLNNLGTVIDAVPPQINWTGNHIKLWVWIPDHAALVARAATLVKDALQPIKVANWPPPEVTFTVGYAPPPAVPVRDEDEIPF